MSIIKQHLLTGVILAAPFVVQAAPNGLAVRAHFVKGVVSSASSLGGDGHGLDGKEGMLGGTLTGFWSLSDAWSVGLMVERLEYSGFTEAQDVAEWAALPLLRWDSGNGPGVDGFFEMGLGYSRLDDTTVSSQGAKGLLGGGVSFGVNEAFAVELGARLALRAGDTSSEHSEDYLDDVTTFAGGLEATLGFVYRL